MVAIIDYGMGNIHSVNKALELYGAKTVITNKQDEILNASKAVLPGVGAFGDAMQQLDSQGLIACLSAFIKNKRPLLGICLGMQLLFEESQEAEGCRGLGILKGTVKRFEASKTLKVPHMGWNQLKKTSGHGLKAQSGCPLLKDIPEESYVYFCHSFYPQPKEENVIAATTDYGVNFSSVVWQDNVYGVQFHPEKSQSAGLKIMENFVKRC